MVTWVFYHSADLDGHCSGAICREFLEKAGAQPKMRGINYGDPFPIDEIGADDRVYVVDFCLQPEAQMLELKGKCGELIWIDHHKSSIEALKDFDCLGIRRVGDAACELCWEYFDSDLQVPYAVTLLGRYDVWDNADKEKWDNEIYPFQMGMRLYPTDPATEVLIWRDAVFGGGKFDDILASGHAIVSYQTESNKKLMKNSFEIDFEGMRWIVVNGVGNSQIFESRYDSTKHHGMLVFENVRGQFWTIILYSDRPDVDVSVIAKKHGGGGHKGASGFQCTELPFPIIRRDDK